VIQPDGSQQSCPRVDVTIQTASIMRDLVSNFCELMDRTVMLISDLDEPSDLNFIRKHTQEQMNALREGTDEKLSDAKVRRMATMRVFSSAPGTCGLGVGLAHVQSAALEVEGDMEEIMGEVDGEFQGSKVEVLTAGDVEKWKLGWRVGDR
jgi:cobaltochelatase CobN